MNHAEKQGVPLSYFMPKERSSNIRFSFKSKKNCKEPLLPIKTRILSSYSSIDKHTRMLFIKTKKKKIIKKQKHTRMLPNGTKRSKRFILYMPNPFFCNISHKTFTPRAFGVTSFRYKKNLKIFSIVLITFLGRINKLHR